jgi:hypothetical protein
LGAEPARDVARRLNAAAADKAALDWMGKQARRADCDYVMVDTYLDDTRCGAVLADNDPCTSYITEGFGRDIRDAIRAAMEAEG